MAEHNRRLNGFTRQHGGLHGDQHVTHRTGHNDRGIQPYGQGALYPLGASQIGLHPIRGKPKRKCIGTGFEIQQGAEGLRHAGNTSKGR